MAILDIDVVIDIYKSFYNLFNDSFFICLAILFHTCSLPSSTVWTESSLDILLKILDERYTSLQV